MARSIRKVSARDVVQIQGGVNTLRSARDTLRQAGATKAADYVARAMKSAEGALRHAERAAGALSQVASCTAKHERVKAILALADEQYEWRDGEVERDDLAEHDAAFDALVSEGEDNGAYVRAWVWISFFGSELDKEPTSN